MIINFIIIGVSLLMTAFVLVWVIFPSTRAWFEAPKYRFLETVRPGKETENLEHPLRSSHRD